MFKCESMKNQEMFVTLTIYSYICNYKYKVTINGQSAAKSGIQKGSETIS